MAEIENSKPEFVKRDGIIADGKYVEWLSELKQRYQRSQVKAAVLVNRSMLEFYWSLGHDIVALKAESQWGTGVLQQLSLDLKKMFPKETGFSYRNILYMKKWYSFYNERVTETHRLGSEFLQQAAAEMEMPEHFALIPWFHHVQIITKTGSVDEALFYIKQTIANNWSRSELEYEMKGDLYARHSSALTNFSDTMTLPIANNWSRSELEYEMKGDMSVGKWNWLCPTVVPSSRIWFSTIRASSAILWSN